ncbi:MAG: diphthine--ammonia ligase [archaeon]
MRLGALFSGGKDSCYAIYKAMQKEDVVCLISIISRNKESYMFHTPNIGLTKMQAKALGLPLVMRVTEGVKEDELTDLKDAINDAKERYKIEGIITGAIASVYQSTRIQKICDELGLLCFNPLWQKDQVALLNELVENRFKVMITGVFAYGLDEGWLGRMIDEETIKELVKLKDKYQMNPAGEGGEIETTVLDAPIFKKRVEILDSEKKASGNSGILVIKKARLVAK